YILHYTIVDPWEIPDLLEAYKKEHAFRDSTDHVVHSVNDLSRARRIPENWWNARHGTGLTHQRSGEMIFFGISPAIRVVLDTILKTSIYKRVVICANAEYAWKYAHELAARSKQQDSSNT